MATNAANTGKPAYGLIILGNAGSGKSFICNLLLDKQRFQSDFQPESVTTITEHERLNMGPWDLLVYNIPGLVEVNPKQLDQNKQEIMRAFTECPKSIVIFVWAQVGGRAQENDVMAFKALNEAYRFSTASLAFVVNNLPPIRNDTYQGKFLVTLQNVLAPIPIKMESFVFIDTMGPDDKVKRENARLKLIHLLSEHRASEHQKHNDILLANEKLQDQRDTLGKKLQAEREALKKKGLEAEKNQNALQQQIQEMTAEFNKATEKANERQRKVMKELEIEQTQAQEDREANARKDKRQHKAMKKLKIEHQQAQEDREADTKEKESSSARSTKTLSCGGRVCSKCEKCTGENCSASKIGAATGAIIGGAIGLVGGGPLALLTAGIGREIGEQFDFHEKCMCS